MVGFTGCRFLGPGRAAQGRTQVLPGPLLQGGLPALPDGVADAISFGEAFASRSDLVARMRQGRLDAP